MDRASLYLLLLAAAWRHGAEAVSVATTEKILAPVVPTHHTVALCAPDDQLITAHLGNNATARQMRAQLGKLGAPAARLDATREVLERDLAAAMRALASLSHGVKLDNTTALRSGLELKGEPFAEADGAAALLERLEQRLERECFVVNPRRPLAMSLALEDLQSAAAERMLTSSGNRLELLDRLYHFQLRCDRMVRQTTEQPGDPRLSPLVTPLLSSSLVAPSLTRAADTSTCRYGTAPPSLPPPPSLTVLPRRRSQGGCRRAGHRSDAGVQPGEVDRRLPHPAVDRLQRVHLPLHRGRTHAPAQH